MNESKREFLKTTTRWITAGGLFASGIVIGTRSPAEDCIDNQSRCGQCSVLNNCNLKEANQFKEGLGKNSVWQLDPDKCIQCGRCATDCVLNPSAVRAVHAFDVCGYCDLCSGYFEENTLNLNTGAENHLCPAGAIKRKFIEDPYFEYTIEKDLCLGCGRCVKGCGAFGNGSLYLQVQHDLCMNCNKCAIAKVCPADAFSRVDRDTPYIEKKSGPKKGDA